VVRTHRDEHAGTTAAGIRRTERRHVPERDLSRSTRQLKCRRATLRPNDVSNSHKSVSGRERPQMSECEAQIFSNITRERWVGMQSKAGQLGVELAGDSGQASRQGFTFTWNYDESMQTLMIQCLEHPFFAPCALVNSKLKELVDSN